MEIPRETTAPIVPRGGQLTDFMVSLPPLVPVVAEDPTTDAESEQWHEASLADTTLRERTIAPPPASAVVPREVSADSVPMQVWEGTVIEVDQAIGEMRVVLDAKLGQMSRHTADIELQWVSEQDRDLVRPGAVFYLTLYKQTRRGSIANAQELRFRRLPAWSADQIRQIKQEAASMMSKMKLPSSAE